MRSAGAGEGRSQLLRARHRKLGVGKVLAVRWSRWLGQLGDLCPSISPNPHASPGLHPAWGEWGVGHLVADSTCQPGRSSRPVPKVCRWTHSYSGCATALDGYVIHPAPASDNRNTNLRFLRHTGQLRRGKRASCADIPCADARIRLAVGLMPKLEGSSFLVKLNCSTDRLCRAGAAVENLAHSASLAA